MTTHYFGDDEFQLDDLASKQVGTVGASASNADTDTDIDTHTDTRTDIVAGRALRRLDMTRLAQAGAGERSISQTNRIMCEPAPV